MWLNGRISLFHLLLFIVPWLLLFIYCLLLTVHCLLLFTFLLDHSANFLQPFNQVLVTSFDMINIFQN
jgi:hypothetical protein